MDESEFLGFAVAFEHQQEPIDFGSAELFRARDATGTRASAGTRQSGTENALGGSFPVFFQCFSAGVSNGILGSRSACFP